MDDVGLRRLLDGRDRIGSVEGIMGVDIVVVENGDVSVVAESEADGFQFKFFCVCQTEIGDCKKKRIIFDRGAMMFGLFGSTASFSPVWRPMPLPCASIST